MEIKKELDFSGIILERTNGKIDINVYGYRDKANRLFTDDETKFGTASLGKVFIAVAIMKLIEQERLALKQPLMTLYEEPLGMIDRSVTIYELLTHTSGIQDYFDEETETDYEQLWQRVPNYSIRKNRDIFPLFIHKTQNEKRRGQFIYNNAGYVLLADVIERITGKLFDEFLKEILFDKLEMIDTGYFELDQLPTNTAIGYIRKKDGSYRSNIYSIDSKGTGAGGCFTTVKDINKFWDGLFSYTVLSEKTVSKMIKKHSGNEKEQYGLGFWLSNSTKNHSYIYIEGCDPGLACISVYHPEKKDIYTALSNCEDNVWGLARDYLTKMSDK